VCRYVIFFSLRIISLYIYMNKLKRSENRKRNDPRWFTCSIWSRRMETAAETTCSCSCSCNGNTAICSILLYYIINTCRGVGKSAFRRTPMSVYCYSGLKFEVCLSSVSNYGVNNEPRARV